MEVLPNVEVLAGVEMLPNMEVLTGVEVVPNVEVLAGVEMLPNVEVLPGVEVLPTVEVLPGVECSLLWRSSLVWRCSLVWRSSTFVTEPLRVSGLQSLLPWPLCPSVLSWELSGSASRFIARVPRRIFLSCPLCLQLGSLPS